ncbi:peptidoglycan-binding protein LysM [Jejudonia soesokkakensis]|uniref:Peptidoglycan-binding protein LysM n=1 Tax=Jejudonia soesokkakensis TaxID=1323432 RepID=A0ABW2MXU9_9FLAO
MKHKFLYINLLLIVALVVATGFKTRSGVDLSVYKVSKDAPFCFNVLTEEEISVLKAPAKPSYSLYLGKTYTGFKEAVGFKESQGQYNVVNQYGYLGKYQFSKNTLALIGIRNTADFLEDTRLQEDAFHANASRNKWILRRDIKRYAGTWVGGVKVTESGILAAAHLGGPGSVKKFLRSGGAVTFNDAFGTSIKYYMKRFSGYDTSMIKADKKAKVL